MLANITQLTDTLWTGGDLHTYRGQEHIGFDQLREIESVGITDIVDLRIEWNDADFVESHRSGDIKYHHRPVDDHGGQHGFDWWRETTKFVLGIIEAGGVPLVHCHMGVNRAPSVAGTVLVAQGMAPLEAWKLIREKRPMAWAIYLPEGVRALAADAEGDRARSLGIGASLVQGRIDANMNQVERTIGRIRRMERKGIPLNPESFDRGRRSR